MAQFIYIREIFTEFQNTADPDIVEVGIEIYFAHPLYSEGSGSGVTRVSIDTTVNAAQWEVAFRDAALALAESITGQDFALNDIFQCAIRRG